MTFNSILVFDNQEEMPRRELAQLSNIGGEQVSSLKATSDLRRKLLHLITSPNLNTA